MISRRGFVRTLAGAGAALYLPVPEIARTYFDMGENAWLVNPHDQLYFDEIITTTLQNYIPRFVNEVMSYRSPSLEFFLDKEVPLGRTYHVTQRRRWPDG